ncbi:hypothetical protein H6P81_016010 [Aristolochia fimbriata]|uniref:Uncharacterized protein n=1 Tax=Aristolochia fimbriata TaxID=158543 RepID=A0AAV7E975_ARIFI|nr:hypothetical protein H6P81_016010 [Aristolochia fimbriata]
MDGLKIRGKNRPLSDEIPDFLNSSPGLEPIRFRVRQRARSNEAPHFPHSSILGDDFCVRPTSSPTSSFDFASSESCPILFHRLEILLLATHPMLTTRGRLIQEANKSAKAQSRNPKGLVYIYLKYPIHISAFWKAWKHIVSVGCLNVVTQAVLRRCSLLIEIIIVYSHRLIAGV